MSGQNGTWHRADEASLIAAVGRGGKCSMPNDVSTPSERVAPEPTQTRGVAGRDPETVLTEHVPAEQQEQVTQAHDGGSAVAAPARSVRRATARRASTRRATARGRQVDTEASIIEFLDRHPGSTAGDLAKGLNLNPGSVANRLTQLAKTGEIKRASHGYKTKQAARPLGQ